jgi:thiopeptide-type bacteriocin biosynthesis protein
MSNNKDFFPLQFVVRIATHPFEALENDESFFERICRDEFFMNALFHAHPLVFRKANQWLKQELHDAQKINKLKQTLYNYYTRMYSNPVPYGYFSSVGLGEWHPVKNDITVRAFRRCVKLDMEVLAALVAHINEQEFVKKSAKFFPNNTIYQAGLHLRYVEVAGTTQKPGYKISAVENSDFLESILQSAAGGIRIPELAQQLAGEDYSAGELSEFFFELVNAQLLIPEIQPNMSGPDPFSRICELVNALPVANDPGFDILKEQLHSVSEILQKLNEQDGDTRSLYKTLMGILEEMQVAFDERHLLQVDTFSELDEANLSIDVQQSLLEGVKALSCFNQNNYKPFLESFKTKFVEKYEEAWIPLMQAIDTESGVSFGYFSFADESALTSGVVFAKPDNNYLSRNAEGDKLRRLLYKKYMDAWIKSEYTVRLTKEDLKDIPDKVGQLGASFQVIFNVVNKKEKLLVLRTAGHSSAGNLLSRFAYASENISDAMQEIAQREQEIYEGSIMAEIVHLPEPRIGNITFRPLFRDYEIPVLTHSMMGPENQVRLSDLMISVREGRIVLWSTKHDKPVIPMLTNAHNYSLNTSPAYQFLSELVYQDMLPSLFMDRGDLSYMSSFNRRIQYENVILYPATWNFERADLQELIDAGPVIDISVVEKFREKWQIPLLTTWSVNASSVLIQWDSIISVQHFLRSIQHTTDTVFLEEYLFDDNAAAVTDTEGRPYYSEFVAIVNNSLKSKQTSYYHFPKEITETVKQKFYPGDEWVYFKIYSGVKTSNKILCNELNETINNLYEQDRIRKFFFIRYTDPEYHLRLRVLVQPGEAHHVMEAISSSLSHYMANNFIWKMQVDTYMREIGRYGMETIEFSESAFEVDSRFLIDVLPLLEDNYAEWAPLLFARGVDSMLDAFEMDMHAKYKFLERKKRSYEQEFRVNTNDKLKTSLDKKEKDLRKRIEEFMKKEEGNADGIHEQGSWQEAIYKRETALNTLLQQNRHLFASDEAIENLVNSFVHMYAIRLFQVNPRENELVGYYLLYFFYHKHIKTQQTVTI